MISDDPEALALGRVAFALPAGVRWLSPITAIVPGQLLAMNLSHTRGFYPTGRAVPKVTEILYAKRLMTFNRQVFEKLSGPALGLTITTQYRTVSLYNTE